MHLCIIIKNRESHLFSAVPTDLTVILPGLTVIAKHLVSSSILSFMAVRHEIHREYLAIVRGTVSPASGTINAPLARTGSSIIERKVDFEHGEHAVTHYKSIKGTEPAQSCLPLF